MTQNHIQPEMLDHLKMTLASHDLKRMAATLSEAMNGYFQEMNDKYLQSGEAQYIADSVANMQHAGRDMLLCIDEILTALDKASSAVAPLRAVIQLVDSHYPVAPGQVAYVTAKHATGSDLSDASPSVWHM